MMRYAVRPMQLADVPQVTEIDRESFPTLWPATSYKHELLSNKAAKYIVAWERTEKSPSEVLNTKPQQAGSRLNQLVSGIRHFFSSEKLPPNNQNIVGFAGMWFMADEAHLTSIAVRDADRGQGIGELLLISVIELAEEYNAQFITLEVRVSNRIAQGLYQKYGFTTARVRPGYYKDNNEDALIMTTDKISSASFQSNFQHLKQAYSERGRAGHRVPSSIG